MKLKNTKIDDSHSKMFANTMAATMFDDSKNITPIETSFDESFRPLLNTHTEVVV
jgi:hypothetical protein